MPRIVRVRRRVGVFNEDCPTRISQLGLGLELWLSEFVVKARAHESVRPVAGRATLRVEVTTLAWG